MLAFPCPLEHVQHLQSPTNPAGGTHHHYGQPFAPFRRIFAGQENRTHTSEAGLAADSELLDFLSG
jgi:hypothetical protein